MVDSPLPLRWLVLGTLGLLLCLLAALATGLLVLQGSAGGQRTVEPPPRSGGLTLVRELGGQPRAGPTTGPGGPAAAPVAAPPGPLRPPRQAGLATLTEQGARRMPLAGAVAFVDEPAPAAALPADHPAFFFSLARPEPLLANGPFAFGAALAAGPLLAPKQPGVAAADARPSLVVDISDARVTVNEEVAIRLEAVDDNGISSIWWWAEDTADEALKETRSYRCNGVSPCRRTWTVRPASPGRVVIRARARDTADQTVETQQVFRVVAEPTATPVRTPTPLPTATSVPAVASPPTPIPTATVVDLTVRAPAVADLTVRAPVFVAPTATPTAPPAPTRPTEPAPILSERAPRPAAPRAPAQPADPPRAEATPTAAAPREPSKAEQLGLRALAAINGARAQAGALPLARHPALELAATAHAEYVVANGAPDANFEVPGTPLFRGETPAARVARANLGRPPSVARVGEAMGLGEAEPERVVDQWLDSVYHRVLVLDLQAQFGGYGQHRDDRSISAVLDLGGKRDTGPAVGRYPGDGHTEVPARCACDDHAVASGKPGPFGYPVTLLLGTSRPGGPPVVARLVEGNPDGPEVAVDLVDAFGNPTLVPRAPLKPGTRYVVRFQWPGGPDLRWSFTTAAG